MFQFIGTPFIRFRPLWKVFLHRFGSCRIFFLQGGLIISPFTFNIDRTNRVYLAWEIFPTLPFKLQCVSNHVSFCVFRTGVGHLEGWFSSSTPTWLFRLDILVPKGPSLFLVCQDVKRQTDAELRPNWTTAPPGHSTPYSPRH